MAVATQNYKLLNYHNYLFNFLTFHSVTLKPIEVKTFFLFTIPILRPICCPLALLPETAAPLDPLSILIRYTKFQIVPREEHSFKTYKDQPVKAA
jgi:hypothetical protein